MSHDQDPQLERRRSPGRPDFTLHVRTVPSPAGSTRKDGLLVLALTSRAGLLVAWDVGEGRRAVDEAAERILQDLAGRDDAPSRTVRISLEGEAAVLLPDLVGIGKHTRLEIVVGDPHPTAAEVSRVEELLACLVAGGGSLPPMRHGPPSGHGNEMGGPRYRIAFDDPSKARVGQLMVNVVVLVDLITFAPTMRAICSPGREPEVVLFLLDKLADARSSGVAAPLVVEVALGDAVCLAELRHPAAELGFELRNRGASPENKSDDAAQPTR